MAELPTVTQARQPVTAAQSQAVIKKTNDFAALDTNKDGFLIFDEYSVSGQNIDTFNKYDVDKNNQVSLNEYTNPPKEEKSDKKKDNIFKKIGKAFKNRFGKK